LSLQALVVAATQHDQAVQLSLGEEQPTWCHNRARSDAPTCCCGSGGLLLLLLLLLPRLLRA
jgi:hypothetical protein